jgi:hypothetical protein
MHTPVDLPRAAVDGLVVHTPHARPSHQPVSVFFARACSPPSAVEDPPKAHSMGCPASPKLQSTQRCHAGGEHPSTCMLVRACVTRADGYPTGCQSLAAGKAGSFHRCDPSPHAWLSTQWRRFAADSWHSRESTNVRPLSPGTGELT